MHTPLSSALQLKHPNQNNQMLDAWLPWPKHLSAAAAAAGEWSVSTCFYLYTSQLYISIIDVPPSSTTDHSPLIRNPASSDRVSTALNPARHTIDHFILGVWVSPEGFLNFSFKPIGQEISVHFRRLAAVWSPTEKACGLLHSTLLLLHKPW